jgi:hypothetical protein
MNKIFLPPTAIMLSFSVASSALAAGAHMARPPHAMDAAEVVNQPKLPAANPTGLPAYLMRSNGLMTNGLLPNNGWQG